MSLEAVQAQAGHRSIESTRIYLHLTNDWLAEQYQRAASVDRRQPGGGGRDARRPGTGGRAMSAVPDPSAGWLEGGGGVGADRRSGPADG